MELSKIRGITKMKISKPDRKYLSREGFLSLILFFLFVAAALFCWFALSHTVLMYYFFIVSGYYLGSTVTYLKIANLK